LCPSFAAQIGVLGKFAKLAGISDALEKGINSTFNAPWGAHLVPVDKVNGGIATAPFSMSNIVDLNECWVLHGHHTVFNIITCVLV